MTTKPTPSNDKPDICLSFKQPWAWLVANGYKNADGRNWRTDVRGTVLIHASKKSSPAEYKKAQKTLNDIYQCNVASMIAMPPLKDLPKGGIVGQVDIVCCMQNTGSKWSHGRKYHYELSHAKPLPFEPCAGQVMFFSKSTGKPVKRVAVTNKERLRRMKLLNQPELHVATMQEPTRKRRFETARIYAVTFTMMALIVQTGYCLAKGFFVLPAINMIFYIALVHWFFTFD